LLLVRRPLEWFDLLSPESMKGCQRLEILCRLPYDLISPRPLSRYVGEEVPAFDSGDHPHQTKRRGQKFTRRLIVSMLQCYRISSSQAYCYWREDRFAYLVIAGQGGHILLLRLDKRLSTISITLKATARLDIISATLLQFRRK